MIYFKDNLGAVFAYTESDLLQISRLSELEILIDKFESIDNKNDVAKSNTHSLQKELDEISPIFFEIREKIKTMREMDEKEVSMHLKPKVTKEQLILEVEQQKQSLLAEANNAIAPLQDAVDLDIATDEETAQLTAWKKYRVLLNRVDTSTTSNIDWSQKPE